MTSDEQKAELLAQAMDDSDEMLEEIVLPHRSPKRPKASFWQPKLGPVALEVMRDPTENILLHGPKGTGKSTIAIHKMVLAMHENHSNLGLMISLFHSSSTEGGIWEKLIGLVLPEWYDGMGLDFLEPRIDAKTKAMYIYIANKFGGWSRVILKSLPPGSTPATLTAKVYGTEPGFVLFDEIGLASDPAYFTKISPQLRRPNIPLPQFVGTCNPPPEGEEHWLHPLFITGPLENPEEAKRFKAIKIPMSENVWWTPEQVEKNRLRILSECKFDPTAGDRLLAGEWVARPIGNALFSDIFFFNKHVVGNAKNGEGLRPKDGYPMIVSYDPGTVNSSVTLQQIIIVKNALWWLVIDEIDHLGERVQYKKLAWEVIQRMIFWRNFEKFDFHYTHITDESAVNQYRPGSGGRYDAREFEDAYNEVAKEHGFRPDPGSESIRLLGCPKGQGSVEARVHMVQSELTQGTLWVSATCRNTVSMFMHLPQDPKQPGKPNKKSKWSHKFDSMSYGRYYFKVRGHKNFLRLGQTAPSIIRCGSG